MRNFLEISGDFVWKQRSCGIPRAPRAEGTNLPHRLTRMQKKQRELGADAQESLAAAQFISKAPGGLDVVVTFVGI